MFVDGNGQKHRLSYAVSADNVIEARSQLERRLLAQEVHGYTVESVTAATVGEAANLKLPAGRVQLMG
ncbi:MAG TPA: hypothetical protein VIJ79_17710 [Acidobacteriaceae bacterium]